MLAISPCETQEPSDSHKLIREWLFRFGVEHKEDVAPRLPLWLEQLGGIKPATLQRLFERAMRTCKFFPKIAEILEPLEGAEKKAAPAAAEEAWERVLDIRRIYWNPDIPGPFDRAVAKLPDRIKQAARASGVFRDHESVEALHVWAKKKFIESFIAYGELQQDQYLLPDGEIKTMLAEFAQAKALPAPKHNFAELHKRGLEYAEKLRNEAQQPDLKRAIRAIAGELAPRPPVRSLEEQKRILRERGFLPCTGK